MLGSGTKQVGGGAEEVLTLFLLDQNGVASALLFERGDIWSNSSLGSSHGAKSSLVGVSTTLKVELSGQVGADWLRRGLEAEGGCSGGQVGRVLRLVPLLFGSNVLLLRNEVVDAFVHFTHL